MTKRRGTFLISGELLAEALALPEGATIINIQLDNVYSYQFRLLVESDDLPEVPEMQRATELMPVIEADYSKKPGTWLKFDWGLKE